MTHFNRVTADNYLYFALIFALFSLGCSENETETPQDAPPEQIVIPEIAEFSEPTPVTLSWVTHDVNAPGGGDPIYAAIESGTFEYPRAGGVAEDGTFWEGFEAGENGELRGPENDLLYAVGRAVVNPSHYYFARADHVYSVFYGRARQPGDPYGSGRNRIPILQQRGELALAAQVGSPRGTPTVQVFETENEIFFNLSDTITPHLVEGDSSEQFVGIMVLNLNDMAATDVRARVEENTFVEATTIHYAALAGSAATQIAFSLKPKAPWTVQEEPVSFRFILESPNLKWSYATTLDISTASRGSTHKRSFRSDMDGSAQYYGVVVPSEEPTVSGHGLVLSLHGAGVQAIGQAGSYQPKDWGYVIAATNRRPFGFDWQSWGRLDALECLAHAKQSFSTDPTRQYLTGHSMGGHGTWHVGVMHPGEFAVIGPSAGWSSFMSYGGMQESSGAWGRAAAHNDTMDYLSNLSRRGVYVIHGDADDNVPVREGRDLFAAVSAYTNDAYYHEEPGAGHWWDGDVSSGVDCVDWPDLFDLMTERPLDPFELEFDFKSPSPSYTAHHSFAQLHSAQDPYSDLSISAVTENSDLVVTTSNVRKMTLNGSALLEKGIQNLSVNGENLNVSDGDMVVGESLKNTESYGPFNQVLQRPFILVYEDEGHEAFRRYTSFLLSTWALIGNGHGVAMPLSQLTNEMRSEKNVVYVGVPQASLPETVTSDIEWDATSIRVGDRSETGIAAVLIQPSESGRLFGVMTTTEGKEGLLFRYQPFASRFTAPDFFTFGKSGANYAGFFDSDWGYDASLVQ